MAKKASSKAAAATAPVAAAPVAPAENTPSATVTPTETPPSGPMRLEDALVALQKTFSRVNELTQINRTDKAQNATALITGQVEFTLAVQLAPATDKKQTLDVAPGGPMNVTLKGMIDTDMKVHDVFAAPSAATPPSASDAHSR